MAWVDIPARIERAKAHRVTGVDRQHRLGIGPVDIVERTLRFDRESVEDVSIEPNQMVIPDVVRFGVQNRLDLLRQGINEAAR